jgi:hypothetical protein
MPSVVQGLDTWWVSLKIQKNHQPASRNRAHPAMFAALHNYNYMA